MSPDYPPTADATRGLSSASFAYDVVIPTHGRNLGFLHDAIRSVERQTLPAQRIVVVVDGNERAASSLRNSHPHVEVLLVPAQSGEAVARQIGIEACRAEWVAFLDDDDLWTADKQERTARYLADHTDCRAVRAGYWMFTASAGTEPGLNGQLVELRADSLEGLEAAAATARRLNNFDYLNIEGDSLALLLEFNRGVIGTTVVQRQLLTSIPRVPAGQRPGADHLLFLHVAAETEWHLIKERLAFYRLHPGQDTNKPDPDGPRGILQAKRRAWDAYGSHVRRPLSSYGRRYSAEVRSFIWQFFKRGQLGEALRLFRYARPLLPRLVDQASALIPDPIVWHWRQHFGRASQKQSDVPDPAW